MGKNFPFQDHLVLDCAEHWSLPGWNVNFYPEQTEKHLICGNFSYGVEEMPDSEQRHMRAHMYLVTCTSLTALAASTSK